MHISGYFYTFLHEKSVMRKLVSLFCLVLVSWFTTGFSQISRDSINTYVESIEKHRTGKNIKLMYSESTPLKPEQQRLFDGLNYFNPDITYQLEATLIKEPEQETVVMKTSTERAPEYIKYGKVKFTFNGQELILLAYQSKKLAEVVEGDTYLFIPFRDETSSKESYGGGRYVDCEIPSKGNTILLDFNKAYNPYCAYNPRFSCVIPPEENRLPVRIEAGEKIFEAH